jgi:flagellar FliL protein
MSEAAEETPKKKGKTLILIIVAANVLLGGGAAAFFVLGQGGGGAEAEPASHDSADAAAQAAKSGAPITEFPPIIVNLNEPEGTRYLKTTIAIQLANDKLQADLEQLKPVIKDAFIRDLSELNFRQTMGAKNKSVIKRRLLKRFNEAVGAEAGVEVLFTEFVVQ